MMMKPIKCKKLAVSRVSSAPRCSKSPGVPLKHSKYYYVSAIEARRLRGDIVSQFLNCRLMQFALSKSRVELSI